MNKIVQGLWIGDKLSLMEQLSIQSFLKNQHDYHLYVYRDVKNIPIGTTLMDGNEILPEKSIFTVLQYLLCQIISNLMQGTGKKYLK